MLELWYSSQFKKDYKLVKKRNLPINELTTVLNILCEEKPLPEKYKDHQLTGNWNGFRECHIRPDWLLIYQIDQGKLRLVAQRTGTHSDLF